MSYGKGELFVKIEFDFWMEQLLIRLYLLFDQTLDYQDLIPIKTKRLTKEYKKYQQIS